MPLGRYERHWTLLVIVKGQASYVVYLNMHIKKKNSENVSSKSRRSCEIIMKGKSPLSHKVVCNIYLSLLSLSFDNVQMIEHHSRNVILPSFASYYICLSWFCVMKRQTVTRQIKATTTSNMVQ